MNKALKIIVELLLLVVIAGLVVAIVKSIQQPVNFNKAQAQREQVAIQRLKDIRSLEVAYNSVNGKYTADFDSLFNFYRNGQMDVIMQIGSNDDSLAVANTEALRKRNRNITPQEMYQLYKQGERLVFSITNKVNVRDTLFNDRPVLRKAEDPARRSSKDRVRSAGSSLRGQDALQGSPQGSRQPAQDQPRR